MPKIGIIGGTGIYDPALVEETKEIKVHTPYGNPSDSVIIGKVSEREIAFLPRHGSKHTFNPSNVNYRANIWALKELGVKIILAPSAVGSLREEIKPGDFVFVDQFIDKTFLRKPTFYEGSKVCHVSLAEPLCPNLRKILIETAEELNFPFHQRGTYICIEGPRFSTRAESKLFRSWGGDVIGMTLVPECVLAREAEICYASIAMVTDYDVWKEKPVNAEEVLKAMKENIEKVKKLIFSSLQKNFPSMGLSMSAGIKRSMPINLKKKIRTIPDFPKKGVMFRDITTLLKDGRAFRYAIDKMASYWKNKKIDLIVAPESRGFIIGATLAYKLGVVLCQQEKLENCQLKP